MGKAVVLLSGGQDSATALFWIKRIMSDVEAIGFNYGQRHGEQEMEAAAAIAELADVPYYQFGAKALEQMGDSDLVKEGEGFGVRDDGLPTSFVPGRNILFLSLAGAYAKWKGAGTIVAGFCQTDYSGYPDCRDDFVEAMENALRLGLDRPGLIVQTPLMWKTKAETFQMAEELGVIEWIVEYTRTCYEGTGKMHDWGHGCGKCPACLIRERGWNEYQGAKNG